MVLCMSNKIPLFQIGSITRVGSGSGIIACCKGKRKSYGNLNGKKLIWKYYEEYLKESV